jgi:integrase
MDLDFAKSQVYVRGKGGKDRLTTLPPSIYDDLKAHLLRVKKLHEFVSSKSSWGMPM